MKKRTKAAIILGTLFLCAAAFAAGSYAKEKLIEEAAKEMQKQQKEQQKEKQEGQKFPIQQPRKCGYILIHTPDGTEWGFYGNMQITDTGSEFDIDMDGYIVGSTHDCYNPDTEK